MNWPPVLLEEWLRQYYFEVEIDLGCSGVEDYSLIEVRERLGIGSEVFDDIVFHDSHTLGGPAVRQAIADRWMGGHAEHVMVTHGSSEAIFLLLNGLLDSGDEVVVMEPCYPQYRLAAETLGCRVTPWPLRFEAGFRADVEALVECITPSTRMVIVNFPNNPTGASLTEPERARVVEACARVGCYLIWDDAFGELTYDRPPLASPAGTYERLLALGTLSKAYGLPGLRVGWCLGHPAVLEKVMRLRDYITLALSPLVEALASRIIGRLDLLLGPRLEQCRQNRDVLRLWCDRRPESVAWVLPQGGVSAFPRLLQLPDVEAFCHRLAQEKSVLLVPGRCFGAPQHVRLGFGGSTTALTEGLERIGSLVDSMVRPGR
jgi:capreomycidine synthase